MPTWEWRDEVVLGRHGESSGSLVQRIRIERSGLPLLCAEVALGPAWPTSAGPAGIGGARVLASTVLVGQPARAVLDRPGAGIAPADSDGSACSAALPLAEGAVLLTALGDDVDATRAALIRLGAPEH